MPVVSNPISVANRLEQLGWDREELLAIVGAMVSARNSCTENDPASASGWMAWKEGTRRMREIGILNGLTREDIDQIPWTVDRARGLKFAVANTDDGTGNAMRIPQNRSRKGPSTERAVAGNQGWLFGDDAMASPRVSRPGRQPGILVSWYLCVFVDGDVVTAELSCPSEVVNGFFTGFIERIVIANISGGEPIGTRRDDDGPLDEFDVPVSRK